MRPFWVAVLLVGLAAAYVVLVPPRNLALGQGLLRACPTRFGEWSGEELSFEDAVLDELKADDLLVRRYERGGDVIWLLLVYHQNARYGAHDPRLCYESQGYGVAPGAPVSLTGPAGPVTVNTFVAERRHDRRLVYYWWYTEGLATRDRDAFMRVMALRGALDNRSWGAFVRVETLMPRGEEARAARHCTEFAAEVQRVLPGLFVAAGGAAPTGGRS